ncbi:ABC transporter permease subunit [Pseudotabrizicola algicola]|uniref:ABC transporter permease subunit n=1 Tax=Pseudotabrizicola algicola TaxID=2709381 RepID=UPI0023DDA299|nr:ABC transporter permease subunit [Pseudotabrizicola algicola]
MGDDLALIGEDRDAVADPGHHVFVKRGPLRHLPVGPVQPQGIGAKGSITLGANYATTLRRVILPLMGPAILAALTYAFVRAITSVSAVIFLVSARHNMATSFIVGRVENGEFGIAIAYATVLIFTMLAAILALQLIIGRRKLRRTDRIETH